jgi:hypothetical protein
VREGEMRNTSTAQLFRLAAIELALSLSLGREEAQWPAGTYSMLAMMERELEPAMGDNYTVGDLARAFLAARLAHLTKLRG